jgi:hypothetical protein
MLRFLGRPKPDASTPTSLQEMRNQSIRLLDDNLKQTVQCQTIEVQTQEDPTQMPKWQKLLVQAFISMGQTPNPFLLSTISSY